MMRLHHLAEVDSTLAEARRLWRASRGDEPFGVVAGRQTAGIGRRGRAWSSPVGGLWLAVAWPLGRPLAAYSAAPLAAALAVSQWIEQRHGLAPRIKWPNDILLGGRKACGILCQAEGVPGDGVLLAGIGLNLNQGAEDLPRDARVEPTSVLLESGRPSMIGDAATEIARGFEALARGIESGHEAALLAEVESRLAWLGEQVACADAGTGEPVSGVVRGLGPGGSLRLESEGVVRLFRTGEIERMSPLAGSRHNPEEYPCPTVIPSPS